MLYFLWEKIKTSNERLFISVYSFNVKNEQITQKYSRWNIFFVFYFILFYFILLNIIHCIYITSFYHNLIPSWYICLKESMTMFMFSPVWQPSKNYWKFDIALLCGKFIYYPSSYLIHLFLTFSVLFNFIFVFVFNFNHIFILAIPVRFLS